MQVLIAGLLAALPNVFIAVLSKLLTEKMLQSMLEKVIIYAAKKAATLTTNTFDDEMAAELERNLTQNPE